MKALAKKRPLLILFEDAQWADDARCWTSCQRSTIVGAVVDHLPSNSSAMVGLADVARVTLGGLDRVQAKTLVERVTGGRLPAEVLAQIVVKTDGVPLFVEELTKRMRIRAPRRGPDRPPRRAVAAACIPSTLQDSLMARLDRLAAVRGHRANRRSG